MEPPLPTSPDSQETVVSRTPHFYPPTPPWISSMSQK